MLRKTLLVVALLVGTMVSSAAEPDIARDADTTTNWTFTYLKARDGQVEALREFIEKNWFAMDAVAVERGLFKDYSLIRNLAEDDASWDFIVAVEYFGNQTYADIREPFEAIRDQHDTVLVNGKDLMQLGAIVRSERVRFLGNAGR